MTTHEKHQENVRKLRELIKDIDFAMLTTVQDDGILHSRPMATQKVEFDGDLYFFTKLSTLKVEEIERDRQVCISYAAPEDQRYVSMSGLARVVRDRATLEQFWFPDLETWFPAGLEEPELALLWISVTQAEYWEGPFGTLLHLPRVRKMAAGMGFEYDENKRLDLKGET
jgi:general stress protein 26